MKSFSINRLTASAKEIVAFGVVTALSLVSMTQTAHARLIFTTEDDGVNADVYHIDNDDSSSDFIDLAFGSGIGSMIRYDILNDKFIINENLDLSGQELQNFVIENAATAGAPTCNTAASGRMYYDTDQKILLFCNGTTWVSSATDLTALAGNGLVQNGSAIDVNVDGSTIEINADALRIIAGGITANEIATNAVGSDEIAADAVTASEIATNAVGADEIAADAVTASEIATGAVTTDEILDGTIATADVADGAIATAKIANDAVTSAKIADGAVATADIADDAVTSAKIANDAVTASEIATNAVGSDEIAADAVTASEIATGAVTTDEILDGTIATADVADGAIATAKIANDAVTSAKIANDAVTASEIATGAVGADEIADGTIGVSDIASGGNNQLLTTDGTGNVTWINKSDIGVPSLTSGQMIVGALDGTATAVTLSGDATISNTGVLTFGTDSVGSDEIAANAVTASEIATDAVGSDEIAADAVTASEIATNAVGADEIAADAVTASEIATGAVTTDEILDGTIATADVADGAIATAKIANDAVTSAKIADDAVTASEIATNAVGSDEIAADAVTASEIATGAVTTDEILDGTIALADIATRSYTQRLSPEFPEFTIQADGSNNNGRLLSDHDSTNHKNYYEWSTRKLAEQDYDLLIQWTIPEGFQSFNANSLAFDYKTTTALAADGEIALVEVYDTAGTTIAGVNRNSGASTNWATISNIDLTAGTFTAGQPITMRFKMKSKAGAGKVRQPSFLGALNLQYNTK